MIDKQDRAHALHKQMVEIGQERGEIRKDLPAAEIAHVFRQTIFPFRPASTTAPGRRRSLIASSITESINANCVEETDTCSGLTSGSWANRY